MQYNAHSVIPRPHRSGVEETKDGMHEEATRGLNNTDAGIPIRKRRFPQKRVLSDIFSFVQNTLESLETVLTKRYPMFLDDAEQIEKVLALYITRKSERQLLDYDDLLSSWLQLLRINTKLNMVRIMIDLRMRSPLFSNRVNEQVDR